MWPGEGEGEGEGVLFGVPEEGDDATEEASALLPLRKNRGNQEDDDELEAVLDIVVGGGELPDALPEELVVVGESNGEAMECKAGPS